MSFKAVLGQAICIFSSIFICAFSFASDNPFIETDSHEFRSTQNMSAGKTSADSAKVQLGRINLTRDENGTMRVSATTETGQSCGRAVSFKTRDVKRIDELNGLEQTANYGLVTAYGAVGAALGGFAALTLTAVGVSEGAALTVGGAAGAAEYVGPATEHKPNLNPMNNQRVLQVLQSVDLHSADSSWSVDLNKPCEALAVLDQMAMKAARTGDAVADASSLKGAVTESKEKRSVASEIGRMLSISLDSDNATLIHAGEMK